LKTTGINKIQGWCDWSRSWFTQYWTQIYLNIAIKQINNPQWLNQHIKILN